MNDNELWSQVAREVKDGQLDEGLWLKARTLTPGPKDDAERAYVLMRVEQLQAELQTRFEAEKALAPLIKAALEKQQTVRRKRIAAGDLWETLHAAIPDMDHLPHSVFQGLKSDFPNPLSATFVAAKAKVPESRVIDAIKAGNIPGAFDGKKWWVSAK